MLEAIYVRSLAEESIEEGVWRNQILEDIFLKICERAKLGYLNLHYVYTDECPSKTETEKIFNTLMGLGYTVFYTPGGFKISWAKEGKEIERDVRQRHLFEALRGQIETAKEEIKLE